MRKNVTKKSEIQRNLLGLSVSEPIHIRKRESSFNTRHDEPIQNPNLSFDVNIPFLKYRAYVHYPTQHVSPILCNQYYHTK